MNAGDPPMTLSREKLLTATVDYGRTWWRDDEHVQHLCDDDDQLRDRLEAIAADDVVTTEHVYRVGEGYKAVREQYHRDAVDRCVPESADADQSRVFFTAGPPGVGKTTVLRRVVEHARQLLGASTGLAVIDADLVRQMLPEYTDGRGSMVVQDEAFAVTYERILPLARERRVDMVFDTIGRHESVSDELKRLARDGYEIHFIVGHAPFRVTNEPSSGHCETTGASWTQRSRRRSSTQPQTP